MFTQSQIDLSYDGVSPPDWRWLKACEAHIRGDTLPDAALRSPWALANAGLPLLCAWEVTKLGSGGTHPGGTD